MFDSSDSLLLIFCSSVDISVFDHHLYHSVCSLFFLVTNSLRQTQCSVVSDVCHNPRFISSFEDTESISVLIFCNVKITFMG